MRDFRFVAMHRGGRLSRENHALLARWAANCAEHVLTLFSLHHDNPAPGRAIEIARAWADGSIKTGVAMKASLDAHAAARAATDKAAIAAARAAGQAVATAHFADHCMGALLYSVKALEASGDLSHMMLEIQLAKLPPDMRELVSSGISLRLKKA